MHEDWLKYLTDETNEISCIPAIIKLIHNFQSKNSQVFKVIW